MTVASMTDKLGKLTEVVQNSQKKPDSTSSMIMSEMQEIRSQELLSSAYEEIKNELQTVKSVNRDL